MIRYYKLFNILNRRNLKLSDLRQILSSTTVAKLRKGEYISFEAMEKICLFLKCQPSDIMEVFEIDENALKTGIKIIYKSYIPENSINAESKTETMIEHSPQNIDINKSDELGLTERNIIKNNIK